MYTDKLTQYTTQNHNNTVTARKRKQTRGYSLKQD